MVTRACLVAMGLLILSGCVHPQPKCPPVNFAVAPFDVYVAPNFNWATVQRVVLMPIANDTAFPRVSYEMQTNLGAELQRVGRFEVVTATRDDAGAHAQSVFDSGQFNEIEVLRVAREYQADAVVFAQVTNYHPYARPRLGLSLLIVSPTEGIAIASLKGLWDSRENGTSLQAQAYFRQTQAWPRSLLGADRVFESPDVFQRFVCQQVATALVPGASNGMGEMLSTMPVETVMPANAAMSEETMIPPAPPASAEIQQ